MTMRYIEIAHNAWATFNDAQEAVRFGGKLYRVTLSYAHHDPRWVDVVFARKSGMFKSVVSRKINRNSSLFDLVGAMARDQHLSRLAKQPA